MLLGQLIPGRGVDAAAKQPSTRTLSVVQLGEALNAGVGKISRHGQDPLVSPCRAKETDHGKKSGSRGSPKI